MSDSALVSSRSLWNRSGLDLNSDEVLAQILDRGELAAWRELYRMAQSDPHLRARLKTIILTTPLPLPHFWLAALASLGEPVDFDVKLPDYFADSGV